MPTQEQKAERFRELHETRSTFFLPNPWDAGSARALKDAGYEALATTSAGYAFSAGKRDDAVGRDEMLSHVATMVAATDLPVSADLQNGYGDNPETVAETIRLAAATGLVGASIEDSTRNPEAPIYQHELAVERIQAAVEAARSLPFPFMVTARCENFLVGRKDLADTVRRLEAYEEAGADVLFAPGISTRDEVSEVVRSLENPVNVLLGIPGSDLSFHDLAELGVRRVSIGSALYRAAFGAFLRAVAELREHGTVRFTQEAAPFRDITEMFG